MTFKNFIRIAAGIAAIVLAIVIFSLDTGYAIKDQSYGGDAYTGIQHAAATAARNLTKTNNILKMGFGSVLLITGLVLISSNKSAEQPPAAPKRTVSDENEFLSPFSRSRARSAEVSDDASADIPIANAQLNYQYIISRVDNPVLQTRLSEFGVNVGDRILIQSVDDKYHAVINGSKSANISKPAALHIFVKK